MGEDEPKRLTRVVPLVATVRGYRRSWVRGDVLAAITVWAIVVPESVAYASIAGMPPETGLYAASIPLAGYALLASSRRITFGPSAAVAAASAAAVAPLASGADEYVALTAALAMLIGAVLLLGGIARLGFVADFLSEPVLTGFLSGVALSIAVGQAHKILGVEVDAEGFAAEVWELVGSVGGADGTTVIVGALALAFLFGSQRVLPSVPGPLVVVVFGVLGVRALGLDEEGVATVGALPEGLPSLALPTITLQQLGVLVGSALGLAVIIYGESIALAKAMARRHRDTVDADAELRALGAANLLGGLAGAYATSGSSSRSVAGEAADQHTQASSLLVVGLVAFTALVLTDFFADLPEAVLGGIVIHAVVGLLDPAPFRRLRSQNTADLAAAVVTFVGVLALGVLAGLLIGVFVSLAQLVARAARPPIVELGLRRGTTETGALSSGAERVPGVRILRFDAALFFANASKLTEVVDDLTAGDDPDGIVLVADAVTDVDTTAAGELGDLLRMVDGRGRQLAVTGMRHRVLDQLTRCGVDLRPRCHPTVESAIRAVGRGTDGQVGFTSDG